MAGRLKCVVTDLDGTLLQRDGTVAAPDRAAIERLKEHGVTVILASGRAKLFMELYPQQLGLAAPVITCNGGYLYDAQTGQEIASTCIEPACAVRVAQCLAELQLPFMAYGVHHVYITEGNPRMVQKRRDTVVGTEHAHQQAIYVRPDSFDASVEPIVKFFTSPVDAQTAQQIRQRMGTSGELEIVFSGPIDLDLNAAGVSKGRAVRLLAERLGVPLQDIACFGDSFNDLTMLQAVGHPIAMGNAEPELKHAARFVTLPNDQCGLAYAVEHYLAELL